MRLPVLLSKRDFQIALVLGGEFKNRRLPPPGAHIINTCVPAWSPLPAEGWRVVSPRSPAFPYIHTVLFVYSFVSRAKVGKLLWTQGQTLVPFLHFP